MKRHNNSGVSNYAIPEQVAGVRAEDLPTDEERLSAARNGAIAALNDTDVPQVVFTSLPAAVGEKYGEATYMPMPLIRAERLVREISATESEPVTFSIYGKINGELIENTYCRMDAEESADGVTGHVKSFWSFFSTSKNYWERISAVDTDEAVAELKERYSFMAETFAPYLEKHAELSEILSELPDSELTQGERENLITYVQTARRELNAAEHPETYVIDPEHKKKLQQFREEAPDSIERAADGSFGNGGGQNRPQKRAYELRDKMIKEIIEKIQTDTESWQRGWRNLYVQRNGRTDKSYRGVNAMYLSLVAAKMGYSDPRWVTFNQAHELGARVKAGAKGVPILFYEQYDKRTRKEFKRKSEAEIKGMTEEERREYERYIKENVYAVLKYSMVFNAEQCENMPQLTDDRMSEAEQSNKNDLIETIIINSEAPITYDGGDKAYYSPSTDSIHLPELDRFNSMQDYYATALHEISHSTGHESRLNRFPKDRVQTDDEYAIEELRAELSSVFLQADLGIELEGRHITNHAAYLRSWLSQVQNDPKIFYSAVRDAEEITSFITGNYLQASADAADEELEVPETSVQNVSTDEDSEDNGSGQRYEAAMRSENPRDFADEDRFTAALLDTVEGKESEGSEDMGEHKEEINAPAEASEQRSRERSKKISITLPDGATGKEYGRTTMLRMPEGGEYGRFVTFIPTKYLKTDEKGVTTVSVLSGYEYKLQNDGQTATLTGEELSASINGSQVGKKPERVAPSYKNARTFANIEQNVPEELKAIPRWAAYKKIWQPEKGKFKKIILSPVDGSGIPYSDEGRWLDFPTALEAAKRGNFAGLTLLIKPDDGITCIDLDKAYREDGTLKSNAQTIIDGVQGATYIERSASGNGFHCFVKTDLRYGGKYRSAHSDEANGDIEVINDRTISITGDSVGGVKELGTCPMQTVQFVRSQLGELPKKTATTPRKSSTYGSSSDSEIIERIRRSKQAGYFEQLYSGKGVTGDKSRDDYSLARMLGWWTNGDVEQTMRIMRDSGQWRQDKGDDYYRHTIEKAIGGISSFPTAGGGGGNRKASSRGGGKVADGSDK